jgi:ANTAR domain/GAF domain
VPAEDATARIADLLRRVAEERARAGRAAAIAGRYEALRDRAPSSLRPLRERMAALHRRMEARHLASAELQELYAARLQVWARVPDSVMPRPMFIDAVATAVGSRSAAITLVDATGAEALAAASDRVARFAHDVEFVVGEGPALDVAATAEPVEVCAKAMATRWPRYGPVVAGEGIAAVVGVPLRQEPGGCLGALCIYATTPTVAPNIAAASVRIADALTHTVLNRPGSIGEDEVPTVSMFDEVTFRATIDQAAGVVSVQHACDPADAVALLRARAFADGVPIETLAEQVVRGDVRL